MKVFAGAAVAVAGLIFATSASQATPITVTYDLTFSGSNAGDDGTGV